MSERIVIGVDGGGTRLRAALVTTGGKVLGIGEAGSGNYHDVGAESVQANISRAVAHAWEVAGRTPQHADAIFLGLGSIVTLEDRATIARIVRELGIVPGERIGVDHDLRVALMGGLAGKPGIVLIAGTGSSCYGRNQIGQHWQAGGWGPVLDDPGSSYWLGRQAMIAAVRDYDGRGLSTSLRDRVVDTLALADIRQILLRVELEGMSRSEIAALARMVTEAAVEGDTVALTIIARGVEELATMVTTVATKLDFLGSMQHIPVTVTGGLTNARRAFLEPLTKAIERRLPQAKVIEPTLPPVLGAALLAIELTGPQISEEVVGRMTESYAVQKRECVAS